MPRSKKLFYKIRRKGFPKTNKAQHAADFIYLNRYCFNGLYRTNQKGEFNVPYAPEKTGSLPSKEQLQAVAALLKRTTIKNTDFEKILARGRKGDFVYIDPPFAVENRRVFKQYGASVFGTSDLLRLKSSIAKLDKRGAKFLLSYAYCKEVMDLFSEWPHKKIYVQRNIAGFAMHRRKAAEVIFTNDPTRLKHA
jgi:DNA adenine methylase